MLDRDVARVLIYSKGIKVVGTRRLMSQTDLMVENNNYEVKIYFSNPLPTDLISRMGLVYDREVCVEIEKMHMKYAEITSSVVTLHLYLFPSVPGVEAGVMMNLFARDAIFEGWVVEKVVIYEIIPFKFPWSSFIIGGFVITGFLVTLYLVRKS